MTEKKKILIVDDDFEIALFLRSTLEIMLPDYEVVNAPSAEEGMLETLQGVDLVISDLNLPGMSGFDFIHRVRRTTPDTPIILITGEREPKLHQEARSLGLAGFFLKPIQVEELTGTVRQILQGEMPEEKSALPPLVPAGVARRLGLLRVDTGAHYAMLVNVDGNCLVADGQVRDLARNQIASLLAKGLTNSVELARVLKAPQPFTINYQAGTGHDLYAANIGANYIIALIFDSSRGRTQIGAVWVYARRAVKDMFELLDDLELTPTAAPKGAAMPAVPKAEPAVTAAKPTPLTAEPVMLQAKPAVIAAEPAPSRTEPAAPLPAEGETLFSSDEVDAFWDSVLSDDTSDGDDGFGGLTLEEAQARGLIPGNFDLSS